MRTALKRTGSNIVPRFILCFAILIMVKNSHSQSCTDAASNEILLINNKYDSAFFLTFDIRIIYNSDTLYANTDSADHKYSEMTGTYTFHGRKALYRLGDIEFMKNDSFSIAVYNNNKFMLVGKPDTSQATSMFIPTRALVDTMMEQMAVQYSCQFSSYDTLRRFTFTATDSSLVYEKIEIEYDPDTYYLLKIKYRMKDMGYYQSANPGSATDPAGNVLRRAELSFIFQNYRVAEIGADVFSETKYLFFDGPAEIKPADAYKEYTIYKNY